MLILPAAALCCLCSGECFQPIRSQQTPPGASSVTDFHLSACFSAALVSMADQLIQNKLSLTKGVGETDTIRCSGTWECVKNHVYWYQKTEKDPLRVILRIDLTDGKVNTRYAHPQREDFDASRKSDGCELMIRKMNIIHSAYYYCACWKKHSHSEK